VFAIYKNIASQEEIEDMKQKYLAGGFGYGHAKQALFELILTRFSTERAQYEYLMNNKNLIDDALNKGAERAKAIASTVLNRVREKIGFGNK
jgi:tryptophanyl-tRNA synthetase